MTEGWDGKARGWFETRAARCLLPEDREALAGMTGQSLEVIIKAMA